MIHIGVAILAMSLCYSEVSTLPKQFRFSTSPFPCRLHVRFLFLRFPFYFCKWVLELCCFPLIVLSNFMFLFHLNLWEVARVALAFILLNCWSLVPSRPHRNQRSKRMAKWLHLSIKWRQLRRTCWSPGLYGRLGRLNHGRIVCN